MLVVWCDPFILEMFTGTRTLRR